MNIFCSIWAYICIRNNFAEALQRQVSSFSVLVKVQLVALKLPFLLMLTQRGSMFKHVLSFILATSFRLMSTGISIVSPPLMAVFGETLPLCHDLFGPCLSAELCSKSQTKRQEETLAMCFPSVQEGQTWWGMDEEGRLFHFVQRQRWGTFEDLRPDIKRHLSEASQTLVHAGGARWWCAPWRPAGLLGLLSSLYFKYLQVRERH